jgi:hypothetical protein
MGRRVRHLNPRDLGAVRCYEAPFLSGFTDAAQVATWTDRCGAANAVQATSENQPTFRTAQFGGQPVVRFDGTNDIMAFTSTAGSAMTFIAARRDSVAGGVVLGIDDGVGGRNVQYLRNFSSKSLAYSDPPNLTFFQSANNTTTTTPAINLQSYTTNSPMQFWDNGVSIGQSASNWTGTQGVNAIGAIRISEGLFVPLSGDIGGVSVFMSNIAGTSIQKRMEHHFAFLFKIPCS